MILATNVVLTLRIDVPNGLFDEGSKTFCHNLKKKRGKDSHQIYSV